MSETPTQEKFKEYTYEPLVMKPEWLTPDIKKLAEQAHEDGNFSILPVITDAVEERGCDDRILKHLKNPLCPHHKNCWALGLLRGQELEPQISDQLQLYATHFNRELDLSTVELPERTKEQEQEFTRLLIIDKKLTTEEAYQACKKKFLCWHYGECECKSLDELIDPEQEERNPQTQGSYAVWTRDTQEADPQNADRSANWLRDNEIKTETLRECLVHNLKFHEENSQRPNETQRHLDSGHTYTKCSGSRDVDGNVPRVSGNFFSRRIYVIWDGSSFRDAAHRARSVVSLPAKLSKA